MDFTEIKPFDQNLSKEVESDHAQIGLTLPDGKILISENISNPEYHCYFKYGDKPPFHNTHMFVEKPYDSDAVLCDSLQKKEDAQIDRISMMLKKGTVGVYVIVEGYNRFLIRLQQCVPSYGLYTHDLKSTGNIIGIFVHPQYHGGLCFNCYEEEYEEDGKKRTLIVPVVSIDASECKVSIAGVHVSGCASQFPKNGLSKLADVMREVLYDYGQDVIAIGDFNTPVSGVEKYVVGNLTNAELLPAKYLTHVNPSSQAAVYDHAVVLHRQPKYEMLSKTRICKSSRALVSAIHNARSHVSDSVLDCDKSDWEEMDVLQKLNILTEGAREFIRGN